MIMIMLTDRSTGKKYCFNIDAPFYFYNGGDNGEVDFVYGDKTFLLREKAAEVIEKLRSLES